MVSPKFGPPEFRPRLGFPRATAFSSVDSSGGGRCSRSRLAAAVGLGKAKPELSAQIRARERDVRPAPRLERPFSGKLSAGRASGRPGGINRIRPAHKGRNRKEFGRHRPEVGPSKHKVGPSVIELVSNSGQTPSTKSLLPAPSSAKFGSTPSSKSLRRNPIEVAKSGKMCPKSGRFGLGGGPNQPKLS